MGPGLHASMHTAQHIRAERLNGSALAFPAPLGPGVRGPLGWSRTWPCVESRKGRTRTTVHKGKSWCDLHKVLRLGHIPHPSVGSCVVDYLLYDRVRIQKSWRSHEFECHSLHTCTVRHTVQVVHSTMEKESTHVFFLAGLYSLRS